MVYAKNKRFDDEEFIFKDDNYIYYSKLSSAGNVIFYKRGLTRQTRNSVRITVKEFLEYLKFFLK